MKPLTVIITILATVAASYGQAPAPAGSSQSSPQADMRAAPEQQFEYLVLTESELAGEYLDTAHTGSNSDQNTRVVRILEYPTVTLTTALNAKAKQGWRLVQIDRLPQRTAGSLTSNTSNNISSVNLNSTSEARFFFERKK